MGTIKVVHTNKLYLPHKWVRPQPGENHFLVNPSLPDHPAWKELGEDTQFDVFEMWSKHDDGAIIVGSNPNGLCLLRLLELGFLSTVKGL